MVHRRLFAIAVTVPLLAALSGCSPLSLFIFGNDATPKPTSGGSQVAAPTPDRTETPMPSAAPACPTKVISEAGSYSVGDCENLTVSGTGSITVTAGKIGTLTVTGNSLQVYAQSIKNIDLQGQLNTIQGDQIGVLSIAGDRNMITANGTIDTVLVNGNDNTVSAGGGFGASVQDNGQRNTITANP
jgi:hypothetical protein